MRMKNDVSGISDWSTEMGYGRMKDGDGDVMAELALANEDFWTEKDDRFASKESNDPFSALEHLVSMSMEENNGWAFDHLDHTTPDNKAPEEVTCHDDKDNPARHQLSELDSQTQSPIRSTPMTVTTLSSSTLTTLSRSKYATTALLPALIPPHPITPTTTTQYTNLLRALPKLSKLTHTSSRRFPCSAPSCTKAFTRTAELRRHQRTHAGIPPFGCRFTGCRRAGQNGFFRRDHLVQHLRGIHKVAT